MILDVVLLTITIVHFLYPRTTELFKTSSVTHTDRLCQTTRSTACRDLLEDITMDPARKKERKRKKGREKQKNNDQRKKEREKETERKRGESGRGRGRSVVCSMSKTR